jgi:DNA-binding transcriptional regulator PaaX
MATDNMLTKREQETFDAIKAKGKEGATFSGLVAELGIRSESTLRPRLSKLTEMGKIRSERETEDARNKRYFIVKN